MFEMHRPLMGLAAAAIVVAAPAALAQVTPEARALVEEVQKAIKDAQSFSYTAHAYGAGAMADQFDVEGQVVLVRTGVAPTAVPQSYKGEARVLGQQRVFNVAVDGRVIMWDVPAEKTIYERPAFERRNDGQTQLTQGSLLRLDDLVAAEPFADKLSQAQNMEVVGTENVGGIPCNVLEISSDSSPSILRWYFGANDHLPRKREMVTPQGDGEPFMMIVEVSTIQPGKLAANDVYMDTPEGYSRMAWQDPRDANANKNDTDNNEAPAVASGPELGAKAPELSVHLTNGENFSLADAAGRTVILAFFDPRLGTSVRLLETLEQIKIANKDKAVDVIALAARQPATQSTSLFRDKKLTMGLATDAKQFAETYSVRGFPTTVIIGPDGTVQAVEVGLDDKDRFDRRVRVQLNRLVP